MDSIFESETYLFDPSAHYDSTSFLSFSSFSDLPTSWNDFSQEYKEPPTKSVSDVSSPTPSDPFEIVQSAFEPATPAESEFGIFHTPTRQTPNDDQNAEFTHRSSGSIESWGEPITPSLTGKSFAALSGSRRNTYFPNTTPPSGFSWDETTPSISGSSYTPPTPSTQTYRVASNPVIGSSRQPRAVKPISSMPALREEDTMLNQTFDPSDYLASQPLQIPSGHLEVPLDLNEDALVDDFVWTFGDYGLGNGFSTDGTIFDAFQNEPSATPMGHSHSHTGVFPQSADYSFAPMSAPSDLSSWIPGLPASQDVVGLGQFDFSNQELETAYTIDPMAVMGAQAVDEDASRPSSAPGLNGGEGSRGLLSVPAADVMTRSLSSEGLVPSRNAPLRDLFSYAPQQIPSGPPGPQPLYTSDPIPAYKSLGPSAFPRSMPLTPTPTSNKRAATNNLSIQIVPQSQSTFSPFPPTPQSATFPQSLAVAQAQPISMQRAGTNPLPKTRRMSGVAPPTPTGNGLPPHLARAQAIVQQQEAREQTQREAARRDSASRRVNMSEASVMQQPQATNRRRQPVIMGWEGPSAQTGSMSVLTHTPLVTVHPPPASYLVTGVPIPAHRVHPPPHPGTTNRPIARLPSSPVRARKASAQASPNRATPSKARSPSGKKRSAPAAAGGFSWGEATFINFTSDDAEKLLTGVAPSGSQTKRKREEEAAAAAAGGVFLEDDDARSKRSKSDE